MADLRDALSKNDLKLPDVSAVAEIVDGDRLLQADRMFDTKLDGVYRRGAVYQRWPQMLSSLAFGTRLGRFVTQYVVVPYGGAFLILECLRHLGHLFPRGNSHPEVFAIEPTAASAPSSLFELTNAPSGWLFIATVLLMGTWLLFLIHRPAFLAWNVTRLRQLGRFARGIVVDIPASILNSEAVRRVFGSYAFSVVRNYLLRPGLFTGLLWLSAQLLGYSWSPRLILESFLVLALLLNTAAGKYVTEVASHFLMRLWHEVKMRVFASALQWIMDLFRGLLTTVERVVYSIDEWLRFRTGDNRVVQVVKVAGGVVWFFVAYLVVFVFTLLVEPQINPIKHFPVVTVSHKLILPAGPFIVQQLAPYLGVALANTLVWTTIWLIPGVFGFLVWELKENWRLYAANRPKNLRPEPIGHHGETMMQLLRPGFHSGTLPKAFAALRRAARRGGPPEGNRIQRRQAAVRRVEVAVRRFVERELITLFEEIGILPLAPIAVRSVRASTNRIDVELVCADQPDQPAVVTWKYIRGMLVGSVDPTSWIDSLDPRDRERLTDALAGLFQRGGTEQADGPLPIAITPPLAWDDWVEAWRPAKPRAETQVVEGRL